jgi:hypothetical protein
MTATATVTQTAGGMWMVVDEDGRRIDLCWVFEKALRMVAWWQEHGAAYRERAYFNDDSDDTHSYVASLCARANREEA